MLYSHMTTAVLVYEHPDAPAIAEALLPDNTADIKMLVEGSSVQITVTAKRLRTLMASCDDLLSNIQVAQQMFGAVQP